jgi:tetratricopeptide (TPR) repeat protein
MQNAPCPCGSGLKHKKCCGAPGGPAQAQFRRGVQALQAGQSSAAISLLIAAIQADPAYFDAYHALGAAFLQSGDFSRATAAWSKALTLQPDSATTYRDLGAAYDQHNLHEEAIACYRKAVELAPKLGDVHQRLSTLYALYSRNAEAADSLEHAADAQRNSTQARLYRADAHMLRGDFPAAEKWARQAVALEPKNDAAQGTLAGMLYAQGKFDEAATHFETALRINPKLAKAWDGLVHCRTYTEADSATANRMRDVLRRPDLNDNARMTIYFALGKLLDDAGDYENAMQQFDRGNRLRATAVPFDRAGFAAEVDRNITYYTKEFFERSAATGTQDEKPLFIVGMYRSGTTLVEQILSSHPDIAAGGELTVWGPADLNPDRAPAAIEKYLDLIKKIAPNAARVTDKLPFNFMRLGAIHAILPNARIIHCHRHPIDTCLSIYTTLFNSQIGFAAKKDDLVFCYREYLRMMDHWRYILPEATLLNIHYEQLIADRETQTRRMIAFTGLPWNDHCLQPEQNTRPITTASAWQARQPVYASSVERWRRYEPWLGALRELVP